MAPPDAGGWNAYFIINDCLFTDSPATNSAIRGNAKGGSDGWPDSPALGTLRQAWLDAPDLEAESRLPCNFNFRCGRTCLTSRWDAGCDRPRIGGNIVDVPWGFPAFYGARRVLRRTSGWQFERYVTANRHRRGHGTHMLRISNDDLDGL